jgi:serine/threonine protein kinase/Tol biopolymer transport system component
MNQTDLDRVKRIFHQLKEAAEPEREGLLNTLCGEDESLRAQVEALLAADEAESDFLDTREIEEVHAVHVAQEAEPGPLLEGPGSRIGPYKLLQVIGEGGFGVVYMAEQETPIRRRVALKVVKPGMDTKQVIARFEAERQALAIMDHPNIAKVFEAGTTPTGRPYFVMELVRGIPITEYCDEQRLDTKERLALFADVCSAVQHAHQHGIIHRDIKPSNVLVTLHDGTPVPMVIDFGIAKATHQRLTERTLFTEFNQFIGTPAYMSPEQATYEGLDVDSRSDVYSLGVLLYELLTGTTPFDNALMKRAARQEILRILKEEEPPKPSTRISAMGKASATNASLRRLDTVSLVRLLRGDLDWIVMKALEKDRRRRYGSAVDMADDINRYFNHQPILARRPSRIYRARKLFRRRRGPVMAAAAMVLALMAEIAYVNLRPVQAPATAALNGSLGPVARMLFSEDRFCKISGARPSPDGTRVAYSDECTDGAVYVRDLESGEITRVTDKGYHIGAVWSPDGTRLAVADLNANVNGSRSPLKIIDLESGDVEMPPGLEEMWFVHDWSPDGEWLAGELNGDEVAFSLRTGEVITLVSDSERGMGRADFSPDNRFVAYSGLGDESPDIWVTALDTRERFRLTSGPGFEGAPQWSPDGRTLVYRGQDGLWAIGTANGRAVGQPRLIRTNAGHLAAWSEHGAYTLSANRLGITYRIPVDPMTAEAAGAPESMHELDGLDWFAWSPDMERMAVADLGDWEHMLLMRRGSVTALPLGDSYQIATLWWAPDGSEVRFTFRTYGQNDKRQTVMALDPVDGTMRELFPRRASIHHIHVSPDGRRMVFLRGPGTVGGPNELVVSDLGDPNGGKVLASESDPEGQFSLHYGQPAFSPDGSQILFVRQDRMASVAKPVGLYVMPSDGSAPARLVTTAPIIARATWDPSGRFIAFQEMDFPARTSTVSIVSVETGVKREILPKISMDEALRLRTWSPDGEWIAFSRTTGDTEMWVTNDLLGEKER